MIASAIFLRNGVDDGLLDRVIVDIRIDAIARDLRGELIHP
ncbi:MAG TPA: hypothetical protein VF760_03190 [Xanthobacteraceae bacterium]